MILMNLLSIGIGFVVPFILYGSIMDWVAIIIFTLFGIVLIKDAASKENVTLDLRRESFAISKDKPDSNKKTRRLSSEDHISALNKLEESSKQAPLLNNNNLDSNEEEKKYFKNLNSGEENQIDLEIKDIKSRNNLFVWTLFSSLAFAECGSRSQISTIIISSVYNIWGVLLGTTVAHIVCILLAVYAGHIIGRFVTERLLTYLGGFLFLLFAFQLIYLKFD
jgi:putative Ca2+/H+ antiporter (TMEM165/GDT1 family)